LLIRHIPRPKPVSDNCTYYAISFTAMGTNFISDQQEDRLGTRIASGSIPNKEEIEPQELLLLREFILLLDQWDRQQEK
jgi:hypothetical protein